ncbi:MAG: ATP-binding protein [Pseudomonadota bacterium]
MTQSPSPHINAPAALPATGAEPKESCAVRVEIGVITAIRGAHVTATLNAPGISRQAHISIGGLVAMPGDKSIVYGMVQSMSGGGYAMIGTGAEARNIEIQLLGEILTGETGAAGAFHRGVTYYPHFDTPVMTADSRDLALVYAPPSVSIARLGTIHQDRSIPAVALVDELLAKHFAVLGTTGSGKSCVVSLVLHAILDQNPNGHIVLIDPHNEYAAAFGEQAEAIHLNNLQLPYWLLNFEELVEVVIGQNQDRAYPEIEILKNGVIEAKKMFLRDGERSDHITVDTPVPYRLGDMIKVFDDAMGRLERTEEVVSFLRLKSKIESLRIDRRFAFMFSRLLVDDSMGRILSRILRIPVNGKPVSIVDISGIPSEIVDVVVSVLARMIFDFSVWASHERSHTAPVLLVCEEAHRYVPRDEEVRFGPSKKAISRIAKEGRKYGVGLCLVSQRPAELSTSALSQCNTIIALRMSNIRDQEFVANALPESAGGLLSALPSLAQQEAVIVGDGVAIPMRMRFDNLAPERRPASDTAAFSQAWLAEDAGIEFIDRIVERWRTLKR